MSAGFFLAELYLVVLALVGLVASDMVVAAVVPSFLRDRAEAQALLRELRVAKRPRPRLVARVEELRRRLRRAALARIAVLTPIYAALGVGALLNAWPAPVTCCIPLITLSLGGHCVSGSALVAAFSFLAFLPLVQEEAIFVLRELRAQRRNKL